MQQQQQMAGNSKSRNKWLSRWDRMGFSIGIMSNETTHNKKKTLQQKQTIKQEKRFTKQLIATHESVNEKE
jgi:hypothetical protein